MQPIEPEQLSTVVGGFGAILQAAGPILNGVANIIGAAKSGGGGAPAAAPPPPTPAALPPAPTPISSDPTVSVSVSINGVPR